MLYTIVDLDEVLASDLSCPAFETVRLGSKFFEGVQDQNGFVISRMISTDPADYLNASYFPGSRLK